MSDQDPAKPVRVEIAEADELLLVSRGVGETRKHDKANWARARLIQEPLGRVKSGVYFDAAPFGRVVASEVDPKPAPPRQRLIPLTQEQLFPEKELPVTSQGTYIVPLNEKGWGCIGLNWIRKRRFRELTLHFAADTPMPDAGEARVQYYAHEDDEKNGDNGYVHRVCHVRFHLTRTRLSRSRKDPSF